MADTRRQAYAALLTAGYAALDYHEQRGGLLPAEYDDALAAQINARTDELLTELHQALAVVQIAGPAVITNEWAPIIQQAAEGCVNSHLVRWGDKPADPANPWQYMATGVGAAHFQNVLRNFAAVASTVSVPRGELVVMRPRPWQLRHRLRLRRYCRLPGSKASGT